MLLLRVQQAVSEKKLLKGFPKAVGMYLPAEEMKELFVRLDRCENPFSCPHGRPTLIRFSQSDLERQFKRK